MCLWRVIRLTIYVLVIMISVTTAQEFVDKRSPDAGQQWFMGSRYGRSSDSQTPSGGSSRRLIVTPRRDDRFHPGSRYGKRTMQSELIRTSPTDLLASTGTDTESQNNVECSYTGVADLYRCHVRKENVSTDEFFAN